MRLPARFLKRSVLDVYWTLRGLSIRMPAIPADVRSVLFVCKGNICRSPFAEHLAIKLRDMANLDIMFGSAGVYVPSPTSCPEYATQAAKQFGLNLENHRSQPISLKLVEAYDMIVAMEGWQYTWLRAAYQDHQQKVFLLPLLISEELDKKYGYIAFNIEDPYGGRISTFEACFKRIETCIDAFLKSIGSEVA
jgi:protein-tyrosine phosphatase